MKQFIQAGSVRVLSVIVGMMVLICCAGATVFAASEIPANLAIQNTYRPGVGDPVGKVEGVRGAAFIMHTDGQYGYTARKGLSIYNGDTLFTRAGGAMSIVFNDNSKMSLAANTSLVINKSIYDAGGKSRLAFLELLSGKARFLVTKLSDYRHSRFNVKTGSSVVGVRGSDFVIERIGFRTVISALGETELQVFDPANPEAPPVTVTSFQQLITAINDLGIPTNMTEADIKAALEGLGFTFDDDSGAGGDGGSGQGGGDGTGGAPLVNPDLLETPEGLDGDDVSGGDGLDDFQNSTEGLNDQVTEDVIQDNVTDEVLPEMPEPPQL
ncbi:MAG: FecR family protein [Thermodesulfobacteriota bacterium]